MIMPAHPSLSITRQCELLAISRSGYYYSPLPMSGETLSLMRRIDEIYTESPEYGSRNIRDLLRREGRRVNRKRVQRLMRLMGIEAIYPKRNLSKPGMGSEHKIYPYLLKGLVIDHPNQVWATDITYIRLAHGFVYLVAIIDWYSRKILSWELSTTMDQAFCIATLGRALRLYGTPEIFNSDQGSQFTGRAFRDILEGKGVRISMDGKGRAFDNIMIERFWRTLKYSDIYLKDYESPIAAAEGITRFIEKYNARRPHDSLGNKTPDEVYFSTGREPVLEQENQRKIS
jgi:putative transposase